MTKSNLISFLKTLPVKYIKSLDVVYHKMTFNGSYYYRYQYSTTCPVRCDTPINEILLTLYKFRGYVRSIHLVYFDRLGQLQQLDYMVKDFVECDTLSDFIHSK